MKVTLKTLTDDTIRDLQLELKRDPGADLDCLANGEDMIEFCDVALGGRPAGHPQYRSTITALNDRNAARRHIVDYLNARKEKP